MRRFIKDFKGDVVDFGVAVLLMDDEIRERIHFNNPNLTPQEFYDTYYDLHYQEYGEFFTI